MPVTHRERLADRLLATSTEIGRAPCQIMRLSDAV